MYYNYTNLVFEGGGVLGIAYLGALDFLYSKGILRNLKRTAGTSAGAISACLTSFSLPFSEIKKQIDSLDYKKVPEKVIHPDLDKIPIPFKKELEKIFGDIDCIYRLIKNYGWYSSEYFYQWIKEQIASQFDSSKKLPPYTFEDFKNPYIHKNQRPFLDLYLIGTDISTNSSRIFCYEATPNMEVAKAVRISMSIPIFFESVKVDIGDPQEESVRHIFSDGGIMRNYPIGVFDSNYFTGAKVDGVNMETLGVKFKNKVRYREINNFIQYIENLLKSFSRVQQDLYNYNLKDRFRSIEIDGGDVSFIDFNITPNDETYNFLYEQGYKAAKNYFENRMYLPRSF